MSVQLSFFPLLIQTPAPDTGTNALWLPSLYNYVPSSPSMRFILTVLNPFKLICLMVYDVAETDDFKTGL